MTAHRRLIVALALVVLSAPHVGAEGTSFDHFRNLAGEWEGTSADGKPVALSFELIAEGTAVLEKLVVGEGDGAHEMATLYHPEGEGMMLTHYCATGNQPRMAATSGGDRVEFELVDVTGLSEPSDGHMRKASFAFPDADSLQTAWTWHEDGADAFTIEIDAHRRTLMTAEDRAALAEHVERTESLFLAAVDGLSPEQLAFKEYDDRWSIAQVIEHLALSEDFIRGVAEGAVGGWAMTEAAASAARHDETISTFVVDRSRKFQAPEPVAPTDRFAGVEESLAAFEGGRAKTAEMVADARDLRAYAVDHPLIGGPVDAYGWLLFLSGHRERHTLQIEEIKTDPGFPVSRTAATR